MQTPNRYCKIELEAHHRRSVDLVTADKTVEKSEVNGDYAEPEGAPGAIEPYGERVG